MHCSELLFFSLTVYVCMYICLRNIAMMNLQFDRPIDLGHNNVLLDSCDYRDYSDITVSSNFKGLAIMQHNIQGLLGNQNPLKILLKDIGKECKIQVILLAETWLTKTNTKRVNMPGYKFVGSHRKSKRGGGVGMLISQNLEFRVRDDLSLNIPNFESITVELKTHQENVLLCSIYRPPNSKDRDFLKNYSRLLRKFTPKEIKNLVIGLDHNLDLLKYDKHKVTSEFIEHNLENHLLPTITKPTRITRSTATLLDNIILGENLQSRYEPSVVISDISDHLPCLIKIDNPSLFSKKPKIVTTRKLDNDKLTELNCELSQIDWQHEFTLKNVNEQYTYFQTKLADALDQIAPCQTITIPRHKIIRDPWLSPGLYKCLKKQQLLYKQTLQRCNSTQAHLRYKTYRNKLKEIIRRAKEKYYRDKCVEFKQNTSRLWKMINKLTNKTNDKTNLIEYLKIDNQTQQNHQIIAEEFAKHFSKVGKTYAEQIPSSTNKIDHYLKQIPNNPKSLFLKPTDTVEVSKLIDDIPKKYSSGHDNISNMLLKRLKESLTLPLCIIINSSISEGVFPDNMKLADVSPLHKTKEKYIVTNYRPISLLVTVSKILEKVIYSRVYNFLVETNQLYQSQYGFRTGHSCQNAISELVGTILKNQEENKLTLGVFIDLSKAFDTLSHEILLQKLSKYGIRGIPLKWFDSYLKERKMRVKLNTDKGTPSYSTYHPLTYGTPQGSCLGPLLFLIFINDLHYSVIHGTSILFADDTTLLHSHQDLDQLKILVEEDLTRLMDWFKANKLTLNIGKTDCLLFNFRNKPQQLTINIGPHTLDCSDTVKFLGVWIDNKLNWNKHINTLIAKLKKNTNLLKLSNKFFTKPTKKLICYAHIYSHLTYGILVWGNMMKQTTLNRIQKIMNTCLKLITGKTPTPEQFRKEKMLRLHELIQLENKKLGYQLANKQLPENLNNLLWTDSRNKSLKKTHSYNTRTKDLPKPPSVKTTNYLKGFQFQSIRDYEATPIEIRDCTNLTSFVIKVKLHFFTSK